MGNLHQQCLPAGENDQFLINQEFWLMKDQSFMLYCTSFFKSALLFTHWLSCTTIFFANSYLDKLYGKFFTLQLFFWNRVLLLNIHGAVRMLLTHVYKLHISSTFCLSPNYYVSMRRQRRACSVPHSPQQKKVWLKQKTQRGIFESASQEAKCLPLYQKRRDSRTLPILNCIFSFLCCE